MGSEVKFEGTSCYKCHASGPLAIHPARADLVSDAPLAAAISEHIADQPLSCFHFPEGEHPPDYGKPLALKFWELLIRYRFPQMMAELEK